MKNKKDGGRVAEEFVLTQTSLFPRPFLEIFFALSTSHGFRSNSKKNKLINKQKKLLSYTPNANMADLSVGPGLVT